MAQTNERIGKIYIFLDEKEKKKKPKQKRMQQNRTEIQQHSFIKIGIIREIQFTQFTSCEPDDVLLRWKLKNEGILIDF